MALLCAGMKQDRTRGSGRRRKPGANRRRPCGSKLNEISSFHNSELELQYKPLHRGIKLQSGGGPITPARSRACFHEIHFENNKEVSLKQSPRHDLLAASFGPTSAFAEIRTPPPSRTVSPAT